MVAACLSDFFQTMSALQGALAKPSFEMFVARKLPNSLSRRPSGFTARAVANVTANLLKVGTCPQ
jgi:hypothetical protein